MKTSKIETLVGAFVLVGIGAIAYLALRIGGGALIGSDTYVVHARFGNVAGVNAGANVVISGVTVGRVEAVRLNPENFSAIVDLELRDDVKLPVDSIVSVKTAGLIGDKYLAVQPGADTELIAAGGTLTETESTVDIESLVSRIAFGGVQSKSEPTEKEQP